MPGWQWSERVKVLLSCVQLLANPWSVTLQAPLSMELSMQVYWSGLPFRSPKIGLYLPISLSWSLAMSLGLTKVSRKDTCPFFCNKQTRMRVKWLKNFLLLLIDLNKPQWLIEQYQVAWHMGHWSSRGQEKETVGRRNIPRRFPIHQFPHLRKTWT